MNLSLGFSTCPNDTFIFDAMIHQKVDTEGLEFEPVLADVEVLNRNDLPEISMLQNLVIMLLHTLLKIINC